MKKKTINFFIIIGILIGLVIIAKVFICRVYKIPTTSMVVTLMPGDQIFVSKLSYGPRLSLIGLRLPGFSKPQRGDVVVFNAPNDDKKSYIKRLIGLEGEIVEIKDGNKLNNISHQHLLQKIHAEPH